MSNLFKRLKKWIENYSPQSYSLLLAVPIIFLIIGFFIWNTYLYSFGFIEGELLKAKFISAGLCFILSLPIIWTIWIVLKKIYNLIFLKLLNKIYKLTILKFPKLTKSTKHITKSTTSLINRKRFLYIIFIILSFAWFIFYVYFIFPILPSLIGGGQPRSVSLIANKETMPILESLEIDLAEGAIHQTENLCIVHENAQGVYVIRDDRILMLDRSLFQGFGSLGGIRAVHEQKCIEYTKQRTRESFIWSCMLFIAQIRNLIAEIFGYPKIFFNINCN